MILPHALAKTIRHAEREWSWQGVFPQRNRWKDVMGKEGRHHLDPSMVQKAVKKAVESAGLTKPADCYTFAIHSQPIYWSADRISEPFRNSTYSSAGRWASLAQPISRSDRTRWISDPITTVRDGRNHLKAAAAAIITCNRSGSSRKAAEPGWWFPETTQ